jgi:periplasmic protein CpxP/Spy
VTLARRRLVMAALIVIGVPALAAGQEAASAESAGARGAPGQSPQRQALEKMVRQRWQQVVRDRLQLNDAQAARLAETTRHFSKERTQLNQEERGIRQEMRGQLTGAAPADDHRLAMLLDSLLDIQRQRLEIVRSEQHELALFMTPLQRVRYLALQEQLRKRMEEIRQGRAAEDVTTRP